MPLSVKLLHLTIIGENLFAVNEKTKGFSARTALEVLCPFHSISLYERAILSRARHALTPRHAQNATEDRLLGCRTHWLLRIGNRAGLFRFPSRPPENVAHFQSPGWCAA